MPQRTEENLKIAVKFLEDHKECQELFIDTKTNLPVKAVYTLDYGCQPRTTGPAVFYPDYKD